jgi:hypothetical protein
MKSQWVSQGVETHIEPSLEWERFDFHRADCIHSINRRPNEYRVLREL